VKKNLICGQSIDGLIKTYFDEVFIAFYSPDIPSAKCPLLPLGEIFVKYNSYGQAYITDWLREQGVEVETPPMTSFFMQTFINQTVNKKNGMNRMSRLMLKLFPLFYGQISFYRCL
jgi:predicted nucleotide-binding protein (sugar kinase/HSP70/actin superfamily)